MTTNEGSSAVRGSGNAEGVSASNHRASCINAPDLLLHERGDPGWEVIHSTRWTDADGREALSNG